MTDQEKINVEFQRQIDLQNSRIDKIELKLDSVIQSLNDLRDRDNKRTAEMQEIRDEIKTISRRVKNISIAAMIGMGALAVGGGTITLGVVYAMLNS